VNREVRVARVTAQGLHAGRERGVPAAVDHPHLAGRHAAGEQGVGDGQADGAGAEHDVLGG
jgi:hypothetical protein